MAKMTFRQTNKQTFPCDFIDPRICFLSPHPLPPPQRQIFIKNSIIKGLRNGGINKNFIA